MHIQITFLRNENKYKYVYYEIGNFQCLHFLPLHKYKKSAKTINLQLTISISIWYLTTIFMRKFDEELL